MDKLGSLKARKGCWMRWSHRGAVGAVVDLEVYCGALLNGWSYKRATLAVEILEIDLLLFNSKPVSPDSVHYHRLLPLGLSCSLLRE